MILTSTPEKKYLVALKLEAREESLSLSISTEYLYSVVLGICAWRTKLVFKLASRYTVTRKRM
jgi:hypothetical protein